VWFTVVGIVEDTKNLGVDKPAGTELYFVTSNDRGGVSTRMSFVVRSEGTGGGDGVVHPVDCARSGPKRADLSTRP
jgi:hypothetical protein